MNSITDLNNISATPVTFDSFRDYEIVFDDQFTSAFLAEDLLFLGAAGAKFATIDTSLGAGPSARVFAAAEQADGNIIVGGEFTQYGGVATNRIIRLTADGVRDSTFQISTGFNDNVTAIAVQADGKILVGGEFTIYRGVVAAGIVRLNSDGTRDTSFNMGTGFAGGPTTIRLSGIRSIVVLPSGKILVGGSFTQYQDAAASKIVLLNSDGTRDTSFDMGTGFDSTVCSIAVDSAGQFVVTGVFTTYNGVAAAGIVRLNSNGTRDNSFNTGAGFTFPAPTATTSEYSVAIQTDGKIVVGGTFTQYQGVAASRIIRLNSDGTRDETFATGTGFNSTVQQVRLTTAGKILVGTSAGFYQGQTIDYVVQLNTDGTIDTAFLAGLINRSVNDPAVLFVAQVFAVLITTTGNVVLGGSFTEYIGKLQGPAVLAGSFNRLFALFDLTTFDLPTRDLVINLQFDPGTEIEDIQIDGAPGNLSVSQFSTSSWQVQGIRSVSDYQAAFDQVYYKIAADYDALLDLNITADDQLGNVVTWNYCVDPDPNVIAVFPDTIFTSEDVLASLSGIQVTDGTSGLIDYTVTVSVQDVSKGNIFSSGNLSPAFSFTGSKAQVNDLLTSSTFGFLPGTDFSGQTAVIVRVKRESDGALTDLTTIPVIVSAEQNYFVQTVLPYRLDLPNTINWQILDQDILATEFTVAFDQATGVSGTFFVNGVSQVGTTVEITGTKTALNQTVVTWQPAAGTITGVIINYNQSKVSNGVTIQDATVAIDVTPAIKDLSTNRTYFTNYFRAPYSNITVSDVYSQSLLVTLSTDPDQGVFEDTDAQAENAFATATGPSYTWEFTGTAAQVQTAMRAVKFYSNPVTEYNGTVSVTFQVRWPSAAGDFVTVDLTLSPEQLAEIPDAARTFISNTSYQPGWALATYAQADILLIGGGGGGGRQTGGGGGAGRMVEQFDQVIDNQVYNIAVGLGGAGQVTSEQNQGATGGTTSAFGFTALGGTGGKNQAIGFTGSDRSGGNSDFPGAVVLPLQPGQVRPAGGGGGGGTGSAGTQPQVNTQGGVGGAAKFSTIANASYGSGGNSQTAPNAQGTRARAGFGSGGNCGSNSNLLPGAPGFAGVVIIKWHF